MGEMFEVLMRVVERPVEEQFALSAILFLHAPVSSVKKSTETEFPF